MTRLSSSEETVHSNPALIQQPREVASQPLCLSSPAGIWCDFHFYEEQPSDGNMDKSHNSNTLSWGTLWPYGSCNWLFLAEGGEEVIRGQVLTLSSSWYSQDRTLQGLTSKAAETHEIIFKNAGVPEILPVSDHFHCYCVILHLYDTYTKEHLCSGRVFRTPLWHWQYIL